MSITEQAKEEVKDKNFSLTPSHFDWGVFTKEEEVLVRKLFNTGIIKDISSVIDEMTPEKEYQLQLMVDYLSVKTEGFKPKAYDKYKDKIDSNDMTPELEAQINAEIKEEQQEFVAKMEGKEKTRREDLKKRVDTHEKEVKEKEEEVKKAVEAVAIEKAVDLKERREMRKETKAIESGEKPAENIVVPAGDTEPIKEKNEDKKTIKKTK